MSVVESCRRCESCRRYNDLGIDGPDTLFQGYKSSAHAKQACDSRMNISEMKELKLKLKRCRRALESIVQPIAGGNAPSNVFGWNGKALCECS